MTNITQIPRETLLHIFSYYLATVKQKEFVEIISKVCDTWKNVIYDRALWETFDGTLCFPYFVRFCKNGSLINVKDVKFTKTRKTVSSDSLSKIYENLPRVRKIDFSNVEVLQNRYFTLLEDKCFDLCEIVISDETTQKRNKITFQFFDDFLVIRGSKITHLDFSFSHIMGLQKLFILIAQTCPNLEELLAQNMDKACSLSKFPIERMQQGCPKLKVLRLGYPIKYSSKSQKSCPGFSELEVFTHSALCDIEFSNDSFLRLLFLSDKLKVLDLRGCGILTVGAVCSLPVNDLERLYISRSKINFTSGMKGLLEKWRHSLIELDISKNDLEDINDILFSVIPFSGMPNLERLTISYTKLSVPILKLIILNCTKLSFLQLEGCRRIGRSMMHAYHGRQALDNLLMKLERIDC